MHIKLILNGVQNFTSFVHSRGIVGSEQDDTVQAAKSGISESIQVFCNRLRRQSATGDVSPAEFDRHAALAAQLNMVQLRSLK